MMTTRTQDPWSSLFPSCLLSFFCISNFSPAVTEVHNPSKRCNHKSFMPPLYPRCIFIQSLSLSLTLTCNLLSQKCTTPPREAIIVVKKKVSQCTLFFASFQTQKTALSCVNSTNYVLRLPTIYDNQSLPSHPTLQSTYSFVDDLSIEDII